MYALAAGFHDELDLIFKNTMQELFLKILILHEDIVEYVLSFIIPLVHYCIHELVAIIHIVKLVLVRKQLFKEVLPLRQNASLEQVPIVVTLDKWRNAKVNDENVDKLLHHYFVLALMLFGNLDYLFVFIIFFKEVRIKMTHGLVFIVGCLLVIHV